MKRESEEIKMVVIKTENLSKVYGKDGNKVVALDNVNIEIEKGEFVAIVGAVVQVRVHCFIKLEE